MLPKSRRVSKAVFETALKQSRFFENGSFTLRLHKSTDTSPTRFGVVVANKFFKQSVDRHLLKRRVYAVLGHELSRMAPGFVALLFYKGAKMTVPLQKEIATDLNGLFVKTPLYKTAL